MSKITVTLTGVLHDGDTVLHPGESVAMEKEQAKKLAALGMVTLPKDANGAKTGKGKSKKQVPPPPPDKDNTDADTDNVGGDADDDDDGKDDGDPDA